MESTEKTENEFKHGLDVLYLANCALRNVTPQISVLKDMDLAAVYAIAKKHSMTAVTYYALENWLNSEEDQALEIDADLLAKWQQARDMSIRKNTMLDITREQILAYFEEQGIWYMPLKGSILKDMYPRLGMRQMADNDILIDAAYRKQVYDYMIGLGYKGTYEEQSEHDEFLKKPCYNFEIHNMLVSNRRYPVFEAYYRNVKERLVHSGGYRYNFRDEDFYIYLMVHAYKHHWEKGNGIRHIMDVHVYLEQMPNLDWSYIDQELMRLGIAEYDKTVRALANKLFDQTCRTPWETEKLLDQEERELLEVSVDAGTYGKLENRIGTDLKEIAQGEQLSARIKLKYFWRRLTWEAGLYHDFPRLAKYRLLRPVLYIARAMKIIFLRHKYLVAEIETVQKK